MLRDAHRFTCTGRITQTEHMWCGSMGIMNTDRKKYRPINLNVPESRWTDCAMILWCKVSKQIYLHIHRDKGARPCHNPVIIFSRLHDYVTLINGSTHFPLKVMNTDFRHSHHSYASSVVYYFLIQHICQKCTSMNHTSRIPIFGFDFYFL